jgi:hypothetical protein
VSGLLLMAWREMEEHRKLLPASLLVGFAPFVILALGAPWARASVTTGVVSLLALVVALILGFTMVSGELAAGRHGFFFARPLAWWQIWGGKLLAGLLLALGSGILAAIPATAAALAGESSAAVLACVVLVAVTAPYATDLVGGRDVFFVSGPLARWQTWWGDVLAISLFTLSGVVLAGLFLIVALWTPQSLGLMRVGDAALLACLVVVALGTGHAAGIAWRSREAGWIGLDLGLFVAAALAVRQVAPRLQPKGNLAGSLAGIVSVRVAAAVAVLLLLAGAAQVALGRTDLHRGHRILSLVFWGLFWAVLVISLAITWRRT